MLINSTAKQKLLFTAGYTNIASCFFSDHMWTNGWIIAQTPGRCELCNKGRAHTTAAIFLFHSLHLRQVIFSSIWNNGAVYAWALVLAFQHREWLYTWVGLLPEEIVADNEVFNFQAIMIFLWHATTQSTTVSFTLNCYMQCFDAYSGALRTGTRQCVEYYYIFYC